MSQKRINLVNGAHKPELLYKLVQMILMIKHYTDVLNLFCSHLQGKYTIEIFKSLEAKDYGRVLSNYINGILYLSCRRLQKQF